jgi:hypothetical protein
MNRLEEFSLRGVVKIHQFWAYANSICDLCMRCGRGDSVPAKCRQVEELSDVETSIITDSASLTSGRLSFAGGLVDANGQPLGSVSVTVEKPGGELQHQQRQRCLCLECVKRVNYWALRHEPPIPVIMYDKYDFSSRNERGY